MREPAPPGLLFDPDREVDNEADEGIAEMVRRLLKSNTLADQMRQAGKTAPDCEALDRLLRLLAASGGTMGAAALARSMSCSPGQLRDLVSRAQRALNVDGHPILQQDETTERIGLDIALLRREFGLE